MIDTLFLQVLGAICILLYGVRLTGQGFEFALGSHLRTALSDPASGRIGSFAAGAAGTVLLQSSGAVVTLLVSFSEIATLPLVQSLAVILGADLGSTLTIQLLSFRIYQFALPVISLGVLIILTASKAQLKAVGQGVLGFGFILLALRFLSEAASGMGQIESLRFLMSDLAEAPLLAFAWGIGLSVVFQSGTAVMILLIAFVQKGMLGLPAVLPLVLGANVGAASIAFVAASGLASGGRRIAWGHMLMKTSGALLFLPFFPVAKFILVSVSSDPSRVVANAHTLFNLMLALVYFPLGPMLSRWLTRWFPDESATAPRGQAVYLDTEHLPVTGAALGQAAREILRMADMVQEMLDLSVKAIHGQSEEFSEKIRHIGNDIELLSREIKKFLSQLGEGALDPDQTRQAVAYISIVSDLETIADSIDKTLAEHVSRMEKNKQRFSPDGEKELSDFLRDVGAMFREAISAFVTRDRKAAQNVIEQKKRISNKERELRLAHIFRLQKGTPESLETSAAHLDILASWKVIASHAKSIAYNVLQMLD
ncbi:MAG TPA: Na/Pi cotransporter family protein [Candidatus Deferrimicrobiaceae bacterium]|jgi:phosphate:Na+ symporter